MPNQTNRSAFSFHRHIALIVISIGTLASASHAETDFTQGTREFSLTAGFVNERSGEDRNLTFITAGWGKYFIDNAVAEFQIQGIYSHDDENGYGGLVGGALRYHFINRDWFSFFGEFQGGAMWTSEDFPTGGTELNFTYSGGPGATIRLRKGLYLIGEFRFQHVSNAFIEGRDRNPIFNSFGGYIGLMWTH